MELAMLGMIFLAGIILIVKGGEEKIPQARAIVQKLTDKYPLI